MRSLPRHLKRVTTGGNWIPEIDSLRFVAILSVVFFHMLKEVLDRSGRVIAVQPRYDWLVAMLVNGNRGVELFFVISGYVLGQPFFRYYRQGGPKISLARYYMRRVTRLEPPYLISLAIYSVALLAYFHVGLKQLTPHLLASMAYMHGVAYHQMSTINGVTWSLEIEIEFYLIVPLMARLFCIADVGLRRVLMVGIICGGGILQMKLPLGSFFWLTIVAFLQYFLAGFMLVDLLAESSTPRHKHWGWDLLSLLLWPVVFMLPYGSLAAHAVLPVLIMVLYLAAFLGPISNRLFRMQWMAVIGGMCYSIYLMHQLIISSCFKITRRFLHAQDFLVDYAEQTVVMAGLILIFSTAFYLLVERPCMDPSWPRKLLERIQKTSAARAEI